MTKFSHHETGYPTHSTYFCWSVYKDTDKTWSRCPNCGLMPKYWDLDYGRSTGCGCGNSKSDHFSIFAESLMSVNKRTKGAKMDKYKPDDLRENWNEWCQTGKIIFEHASNRSDGRW